MAIKLKRPQQTKISNITYNNIIQDVYNLIQDNKELGDNWSDFISSDAGRMMTELFAWISERLGERIDSVGNELFLETAEDKESVLRILKLVGYKLPFPTSAAVPCEISISPLSAGVDYPEVNIILSRGVKSGNSISLTAGSFKSFTHTNGKTFELIDYNESTRKYDYFKPISVVAKGVNKNIILQEGETKINNFSVNRLGHFTILLGGSVISNSVSIYKSFKENNENFADLELLKVDNFFCREAQTATIPVYKVNNLGDGSCEIEFPNTEIGLKNHTEIGEEYTVLYRVGGGEEGNIERDSLNSVEAILLNNGRTRGSLYLKNIKKGTGGKDEPTTDEIREQAPQDVRNYTSAITAEDYEYILKKNNVTLKDVKVYGESNITSEEIERAYGAYSNPLDVWIFALKQNTLYDEEVIKNLTRKVPVNLTKYVNDICFEIFDLNERLNEVYQFNSADLNTEINTRALFASNKVVIVNSEELTKKEIHNSIIIPSTDRIKNNMENAQVSDDFKVFLTEVGFEEQKTELIPNISNEKYLIEDDDEKYEENPKRFLGVKNDILVKKIIPEFSSIFGLDSFNAQAGDKIEIEIEDKGPTSMSFSKGPIPINSLVDRVNNAVSSSINGNLQGIILQDNIIEKNEVVESSLYTAGSEISFKINQENAGEITVNFTLTANLTWEGLKNSLNDSINTSIPENNTYKVVLVEKNVDAVIECYRLVIYNSSTESNSSFSIKDNMDETFLGKLLGMLSDEIYSTPIFKISTEVNENEIIPIIEFLKYGSDSKTLKITGINKGKFVKIKNSRFVKALFGLSDGDFEADGYLYLSGEIILAFTQNRDFIMGMPHIKSKLPNPIYSSAFWGTTDSVFLGSYYEEIENNEKIPSEIRPLLKRQPIGKLYNTVYKQSERSSVNDVADIYNSRYELKFTRRKVDGYTFHQIGETESPPLLKFKDKVISNNLGGEDVLKIKVNGKKLEGFTEGTLVNLLVQGEDGPQTITNVATYKNGFVEIYMSNFRNLDSKSVADAIVEKFFLDELSVLTEIATGFPYFQTTNNFIDSSINITGTSVSTFKEIFYGDYIPVISSETSVIGVSPIEYKKIVFSRVNFASNKYINITITPPQGSTEMKTINTSTSFENFKRNVEASFPEEILFNDEEMVFLSKKVGYTFNVSINFNLEGYIANENYFSNKASAESFIPSLRGLETTNTNEISIEQINTGDYYIDVIGDKYELKIQNLSRFPYGDIYVHMIEDYRKNHMISERDMLFTDEYEWNQSINSKKMICVNHIYKQPRFIPFDLEIQATIIRNAGLEKEEEYKKEIESFLRNIYNVYESKIGEDIDKNTIAILIQNNINYVKNVFVKYLGPDLEGGTRNTSTLDIEFNEKGILASNEIKETIAADGITIITTYLHGAKIEVEYER